MFRLVFKHQGTRYSFDQDSGALEELAKQLRDAAHKKALEEAAAQPQAAAAASLAGPPNSGSASASDSADADRIHAKDPQSPVQVQATTGQGQKRRKRKKRPRPEFDGTVFWIAQKRLRFGSNAKKPRDTRPVVRIERRGPVVPVLPCTSDEPKGRAGATFFHLDGWSNWFPSVRDVFPQSWVFRRAEAVRQDDLGAQWGRLPSDVVEGLRRWLRGEDVR